MPNEPVEIKVTLSEKVPNALSALGLDPGHESSMQIWFLEDETPGIRTKFPLLAAGIVIRLRSSHSKDDSTIKLRPCRRTQLIPKWSTSSPDGKKYRLEQDWAGQRRTLAASAGAECDAVRATPMRLAARRRGSRRARSCGCCPSAATTSHGRGRVCSTGCTSCYGN
jgi:hypothetical protein